LKLVQFESFFGYGFLFAVHSNYSSILYYFRDKVRYWSKIAIISYTLHSTPPLVGSRRDIIIYHLVLKN